MIKNSFIVVMLCCCFSFLKAQTYETGFDEVYQAGADGLSKGQGRTQADNVKSSYAASVLEKQKERGDTLASKYAISINPSVVLGRDYLWVNTPNFAVQYIRPAFGLSLNFEKRISKQINIFLPISFNKVYYSDNFSAFDLKMYNYLSFGFGFGFKLIHFRKHTLASLFELNFSFITKHYAILDNEIKNLNHNGKFGIIGKAQLIYFYTLSTNYEIGLSTSASHSILQFPGPPPLYNGHIASYFDFGLIFKRNF